MHVLLAEDDRAVRDSLTRALTLEGYDVRAVSNGALALDALNETRPRSGAARRVDADRRRADRVPSVARRTQPACRS